MLKLEFIEKDEYANYVLKDSSDNKYEININFMDIEIPQMGTILYIPEEVVNEKVSLNYGKVDFHNKIAEENLIVLVKNDKKIYLERFFG